MGKIIQIFNSIILGFFFIVTSFTLIGGSFFFYFIWVTYLIYFIFLILSFKKCDINSKFFNWAFYLNLSWILLVIFSVAFSFYFLSANLSGNLAYSLKNLEIFFNIINYFSNFLYLISFTIFLIGYFNSKKNLDSNSSFILQENY